MGSFLGHFLAFCGIIFGTLSMGTILVGSFLGHLNNSSFLGSFLPNIYMCNFVVTFLPNFKFCFIRSFWDNLSNKLCIFVVYLKTSAYLYSWKYWVTPYGLFSTSNQRNPIFLTIDSL